MIFYNGNIITMDKNKSNVKAIRILDNVFTDIGSDEEVLALKESGEALIDLQGKTVIPGLNDSHMHLYGFGSYLNAVDLMNVQSIEEIKEKVKLYIQKNNVPRGTLVKGRGWNQDYFTVDKRFPTRHDLDEISTEHPIVLSRACGHMLVVNSKALEICQINHMTNVVEGGEFDVDNGIFKENAMGLIYSKLPHPTVDELKRDLLKAMAYANSKGLTSIQTDDLSHGGSFKNMLLAYETLRDEGKLTCRIYEQCLLDIDELDEFIGLGYKTGVGNHYFKIGPLKILSDGSLGARTAALSRPYADDPKTSGMLCFTESELDALIIKAHEENMQIAVHCIGDKAMDVVLNSYEKALKKKARNNHRHGIIHCQIMDGKMLDRYKDLDVCAYIQPIFLHYDMHIVEDRVGKELASTSYAFKSMIDKGIHTSLGTDCPVEALDPMPNIYSVVTRCDLTGYPQGGYQPSERLDIKEALYHYTVEGAYMSFEEGIKGKIKEDYLADFVILGEDIINIDPMYIKDIKVLKTYVGGKLVYSLR